MRLCVGTSKGIVVLDADRNAPVAVSAVPSAVACMAQSAADPAMIYAGSIEPEGSSGAALFRSRDGGRNWADITPIAARGEGVCALAAPPGRPAQVWFGSSQGRVFYSLDHGRSFQECPAFSLHERSAYKARSHPVVSIAFAPAPAGDMFVAIGESGIFHSPDRGSNFATCDRRAAYGILGLAVDPASPARVYAATAHGFYRSEDSGGSWEAVRLGCDYVHPVFADRGGIVYTAAAVGPPSTWAIDAGADATLFVSADRGHSFSSFGEAAGPHRGMIVAIVGNAWCPEERFAVTTDGTVLRWQVGEENVHAVASKLPPIYALVVLP